MGNIYLVRLFRNRDNYLRTAEVAWWRVTGRTRRVMRTQLTADLFEVTSWYDSYEKWQVLYMNEWPVEEKDGRADRRGSVGVGGRNRPDSPGCRSPIVAGGRQ